MPLEPRIIYESPDFLILNKPSGLQVHPARINEHRQKIRAGNDEAKGASSQPTLTDWLVRHYPEVKTVGDDPAMRPGIVHRLDKETSGIMIVPRNQKTFEYLKKLFQEHKIQKRYLALVVGAMEKKEGIIDAPIGIKNGTLKRSVHAKKNGEAGGHGISRDKRSEDGIVARGLHAPRSDTKNRAYAPDSCAPREHWSSDRR